MLGSVIDKIRRVAVSAADSDVYAIVASEMARGQIDPGLMAKAYAECGGNEQESKARYITPHALQICSPTWLIWGHSG